MKNLILFFACIFFITIQAQAQTKSSDYKKNDYLIIEGLDGSKYKGNFISETKTHIEIEVVGLGATSIEKRYIKHINKVDKVRIIDGKYFYESPIYSKYFVSESAISLKKGEGFYQNLMVFGNIFAYGVTNNFTITGGFETLSLFAGRVPGLYISPKITFSDKSSNMHFGIGANFATYQFDNLFGSTYGMLTYGDTYNNITAGVGFGFYADDRESDFSGTPVFNISGMTRVAQKFGVVADVFYTQEFWTGTFALRYMTEKVAFDIGGAFADGSGVPILGVTVKL